MSVSVDGGPRGRRRPVSAELNLVAYIDLLTCMVSFLLITAVWAQLARLPVSQHQPGQADGEAITEDFRIVVVVNGYDFSLVMGGVIFGWAKPVPVNFGNLRHPKRDMFWVAAAGPGSNVVQALVWATVGKVIEGSGSTSLIAQFWLYVAFAGISWNVVLAVFNLFPILPLDGGRMITSILPNRLAYEFSKLERYGMLILIGLLVLMIAVPQFGGAVMAVMNGAENLIVSLFGLE